MRPRTADLGLHRFALAQDRASTVVELAPHDHVALATLIDANIELGWYDQAEQHLDELLALRPGLQAYTRLSYFRQLTGDDEGAIEAMFLARSAADGLGPEAAKIEALLGELHFTLGDNVASARHYQQSLQLDSSRLDAAVGLATIDWSEGRADAAMTQLGPVFDADPVDTSALMLAAEINRSGGLDDVADEQASLVVNAALDENASGYGIDPSVALFASSWGEPTAGLELATIIYLARPDNVKAAHAMAWAFQQVGRTDDALVPLETALQFGTTDHRLHVHSAEILAALGHEDRALEQRAQAEAIIPGK